MPVSTELITFYFWLSPMKSGNAWGRNSDLSFSLTYWFEMLPNFWLYRSNLIFIFSSIFDFYFRFPACTYFAFELWQLLSQSQIDPCVVLKIILNFVWRGRTVLSTEWTSSSLYTSCFAFGSNLGQTENLPSYTFKPFIMSQFCCWLSRGWQE